MITNVHFISGGYIVEYDDGYIAAICAYEQAEEAAERWCDEHHVLMNSMWLVNGWDAADEKLRDWGYEPETLYF